MEKLDLLRNAFLYQPAPAVFPYKGFKIYIGVVWGRKDTSSADSFS
jgi:hypothetical protein